MTRPPQRVDLKGINEDKPVEDDEELSGGATGDILIFLNKLVVVQFASSSNVEVEARNKFASTSLASFWPLLTEDDHKDVWGQ